MKPIFSNKVIAAAVICGLLASLSACNKPAENPNATPEKAAPANATDNKTPDNKAPDNKATQSSTANSNTPKSDPASSNAASKRPAVPVEYPFRSWQTQPVLSFTLKDIKPIHTLLGTPTRIDPKSLDYTSNIATKYSYAAESAPYLDVIDSPTYLELGWYYANPTDGEAQKKLSVSYAAKAYQIALGLLGKDGDKLMQDILGGQVIKEKPINGKMVALAKCEFFSCQLIFKK